VNIAALHAQELTSRGPTDPLGLRAAVNAESAAQAEAGATPQPAARSRAERGPTEPAAHARGGTGSRGPEASASGGANASSIDDGAGQRSQAAGAERQQANSTASAGERRGEGIGGGRGLDAAQGTRGAGPANAAATQASSAAQASAGGAERSGTGGVRGADAVGGLRALEHKAHAARASREASQSQGADRPRGALVAQEEPVAAQAVRGLSIALRQGGGTVMLRLEPELLGTLRVQLTIEQGVVAARIEASTQEARELLERGVDTLRGALEARGLGVERIEIRPPEAGVERGQSAFAGTADQQGLTHGGAERDPGTDARGMRDGAGGGPRGATGDPGMDAPGPGEIFWPAERAAGFSTLRVDVTV
jgi:flagellar hook-length control protein FliK